MRREYTENPAIIADDKYGRQSSDVGKNIFKGAFSALSSSTRGNFHVSSPVVSAAARAGEDNRSFDAIEVVGTRQPQTAVSSTQQPPPPDKPKLARTMSEFIQVVQGTSDHGESLPSSTVVGTFEALADKTVAVNLSGKSELSGKTRGQKLYIFVRKLNSFSA